MKRNVCLFLVFLIISSLFPIGIINAEENNPIVQNQYSSDENVVGESGTKNILTIDWLSQHFAIDENRLLEALNKGYTLQDLQGALESQFTANQSLDEALHQINPNVMERLQRLDYSADWFAHTEDVESLPSKPSVTEVTYGELVEMSGETIITDESIFYPQLDDSATVTSDTYETTTMRFVANSTKYPTSYDELAVSRLNMKAHTAPFSWSSDEENVSMIDGSLQVEAADMVLPGRNGLSFALKRRYNSNDAVYYDKEIYRGSIYTMRYYPELASRLYYLVGEVPVERVGSASDFFFTPSKYASFVQYYGRYTYWNFPTRYPIVEEFNNEVRNSLEASWRYVDPNDPSSYPFMSRQFTIAGTDLIAKAFTTGNVVADPMVNSQYRGDAYANKTKPILNEHRFPLGKGWSWDIPYIESREDRKRYLHLFGGGVYELSGLTLKAYPWKDLSLIYDSTVTVNDVRSAYLLQHINGSKQYFSGAGRLIQISDIHNNTIQFEYQNVSPYGEVLSKIRDAIGNEITITYTSTEVRLESGDRTVIYSKIKDSQNNKELLSQVTDAAGRNTRYVYEVAAAPFDLVNGKDMNNYVALLKQIHHPTKSRTEYQYTGHDRKLGPFAKEKAFRVKSREDVISYSDGTETSYNQLDYYYSGDGASNTQNTFTFSTTVDNGRTNKKMFFERVYIDDSSPAVYYNTKIQENDGTLRQIETMTYNRNKQWPSPIQVNSKFVKGTSESSESIVKRTYDDYGNMTSETDPNGITTTYTYDAQTHLLKSVLKPIQSGQTLYTQYDRYPTQNSIKQITVRDNNVSGAIQAQTNYTYDAHGNPTAITIKDDNRNVKVNFEYGTAYSAGFPTKQWIVATGADGVNRTITQRFEYHKLTGAMTKYTDGKGHPTTYQYDKLGRVTKVIYPDTSFDTWTYNDTANQITVVDSTGVTSRVKWNPLGWKVSEGIVGKSELTYGYDSYGRVLWSEDGAGNRTGYQYDKWDRLTRTNYPGSDQAYTQTVYNDINRTVQSYDGERNRVVETYDKVGRLTSQKSYSSAGVLANAVTYTHDYVGNVLTMTDGKNQTTTYTYDVLGRLVSVLDPVGNQTSYKYSLANQLTETVYPDQNKLMKEYDQMGRLIRRIDPSGAVDTYTYDANSNVTKTVDRKGQAHTYTYNNRDFLMTSVTGDETVHFAYDTAGRRLSMTDATGTTQYTYAAATGWLKTVTFPDDRTIQYQYDARGNRTRMTDPFGKVTTYQYDANSRLQSVGPSASNHDTTYSYRKNSQLSSMTQKNGVNSQFGYNGLNLSSLTHKKSGGANLQSSSYVYDVNRNITEKTEQGTSHSFTYDALNRIGTSTQFDETYTYDNRGNRLTMQSDKPLIMGESSYTYDQRDRLKAVTQSDGTQVAYTYNGDGLLVERTESGNTTRYYYDGAHMIAEAEVVNGTAQHVASYIRGNRNQLVARVDTSGSKAYYVHNGHGDVIGLTNSAGNFINTYTYDIWGNPQTTEETVPNPFRYSGEYWDETTGLQYLRARWYDPSMGRFINEDSYEGDISNPLTLNLYTYVHNNPLIFIDPSGHAAACTSESSCIAYYQSLTPISASDGLDYLMNQHVQEQLLMNLEVMSGSSDLAYLDYMEAQNDILRNNPCSYIVDGCTAGAAAFSGMDDGFFILSYTANGTTTRYALDSEIGMQSCNCFTAGTTVLTEDGEVPIEQIQVGDKVLAKDEETGDTAFKEVEWLFQREVDATYNLHIGDTVISTTDEHPFWIVDKGWVKAADLEAGYILVDTHGNEVRIDDIEIVHEKTVVYNFMVKDYHTYFVSNLGIWTHNACKLASARRTAVRQAWKQEKALVEETGAGSRRWTEAEKQQLLQNGKVQGYYGHHINSVKGHPNMAGDPNNIEFVTFREHLARHQGNFRNITKGILIFRKKN